MIYFYDIELTSDKSIFYAVQDVYGIGEKRALFICKKLGFSKNLKVGDLNEEQETELLSLAKSLKLTLSADLKRIEYLSLKNHDLIKSYKGVRRKQGLPLRGQRTHTNSKTAKK